MDGRAEGVTKAPRMPVVVAVGEHDVLRHAMLLKPRQAFVRDQRVNRDALPLEVVGAERGPDQLAPCLPMPHSRSDFTHERRLPGRRFASCRWANRGYVLRDSSPSGQGLTH